MYPLRYVSSFSFLFGICRFPEIIKKAPDRPQRGWCCRGGCDSHPQPGSKQDCVISTTSCPTASWEPKEQRSESPNTDISVHRTPVSSLGPVSCCLVWAYSVSDFFTMLAGLASLPSGTLYSPQPPTYCTKDIISDFSALIGFSPGRDTNTTFFMLKPQDT